MSGTGAVDTFGWGRSASTRTATTTRTSRAPPGAATTTIRAEVFERRGQGGPDVISGAGERRRGRGLPEHARDTRLNGGPGNDQLTGGDGIDTITGGLGNDTENGGNGQDFFNEEAGANGNDDFVGGGSPYDTLDYSQRTVGVGVDLDGVADDGQPGAENDNVHSDIEIVYGGSGGGHDRRQLRRLPDAHLVRRRR